MEGYIVRRTKTDYISGLCKQFDGTANGGVKEGGWDGWGSSW